MEAGEAEFLAAWNEMLLEIPRERLVRMEELKGRYRLGILSNTNERHIDAVNGYLKQRHGIDNLDTLVHTPLYSHLVRMRKPEPRVYAHAVAALGVVPERILFIDDNRDNAAAATAAGLVGYYLDLERETVLDVLQRFG
jgi:putative hydrolase of the HAD superfamily